MGYRCHIAGPVFTRLLARAREADPVGDIACAWELLAEEWRETGELPPGPPSRCRTARRSCTWITRCCTQTDEDAAPAPMARGRAVR